MRRNRVPRLYDLHYEKPPTLVKRQLRLEVRERLNFKGEVLRPLETADVDRAVDLIIAERVESVAVCLLHSYANPDHERYIGKVLRDRAPHLILTLSSDLLPEMKEYERTSTTVINCYVRPVVERYLKRLTDGLRGMGIGVPLTVMQSNGAWPPPPLPWRSRFTASSRDLPPEWSGRTTWATDWVWATL